MCVDERSHFLLLQLPQDAVQRVDLSATALLDLLLLVSLGPVTLLLLDAQFLLLVLSLQLGTLAFCHTKLCALGQVFLATLVMGLMLLLLM